MNTPNIDLLRQDLKRQMLEQNVSQVDLQKLTSIRQPNLSSFLSGKRGLSFTSVIKLWPFVYGLPFPQLPQDFGIEGDAGAAADSGVYQNESQ